MAEELSTGPDQPRRRGGRKPSAAKRDAIVAAATELFVSGGYARTSMDAITAAAGVSKQTVYAHFGDKESLFLAVVERSRTRAGDRDRLGDRPLLQGADLRAALIAFGERHLRTVLDPGVAALRRMLIAELGHHRQLHRLWQSGGPTRLLDKLAAEFAARTKAGELDTPRPDRAVAHLIAVLTHEANTLTMYGVRPLSGAERTRIATDAAELFLRAYGG